MLTIIDASSPSLKHKLQERHLRKLVGLPREDLTSRWEVGGQGEWGRRGNWD